MDQSTLDDDHFAYCYNKPRKTDIAKMAESQTEERDIYTSSLAWPNHHPIIKNMFGKGQVFATSAHRLYDAKPTDLGRWVKIEDREYVFCPENEAEGVWVGFSTINDVRCAIIDTNQRGRFSR